MTNFNNNTTAANNNENAGMGNGRGFNTVTLMNCRIAGPPTYTPAHTKPGAAKAIDAQANFTVYQNIRDKKMEFKVTAWGKMADVIARGAATGKQIHLTCTMHSYRGRVWLPTPPGAQRQFVTTADGQPLMSTRIGFTLDNMNFGVDSAKTIQEEIQSGFRPQGWNDPTQPGYQQWRQICANNNKIEFQPGMQQFGYARVSVPEGQVAPKSHGNNFNNGGGYNAGNQNTGSAQPYNNGFQGNQNPPAAGFQGGQPNGQVQVNGQNVGYPVNNHPAPNQSFQGNHQQNGGFQNQNAGAQPVM